MKHTVYAGDHEAFSAIPGERFFTNIPLFHATAAIHTVTIPLLDGNTLAMSPIFSVENFLDDMRLLMPFDRVVASKSQYLSIAIRSDLREGELRGIKRVYDGGEILFEADAKRTNKTLNYLGAPSVRNCYGMSEFGTVALMGHPESLNWIKPVAGAEARIVNEIGKPIEGDGIGRLHVKTVTRMKGYFNNPEATNEFFLGEGWCDTGDIAERKTIENSAYYDVFGRDTCLTCFSAKNGQRVYGILVDRFLLKNDNILHSQTIALPIADMPETHTLVTHIVLEPSFNGDKDVFLKEVIAACRNEFSGLLVPSGYKVIGDMPISPTVNKRDIPLMATDYDGFFDLEDGNLIEKSFGK